MRFKPTTQGTWTKTGKKRYEHMDGHVVAYDCNRWAWIVQSTGAAYSTLWAAQWAAERS